MTKIKWIVPILVATTVFFLTNPFCAIANVEKMTPFIFKGNTVYSAKTLNRICSKKQSKNVKQPKNIPTQSCAQKVTHFYRIHGYLLTKAETSRTNKKTIVVIEGKYAKITVKSTIPGSTNFLQSFFQNEQPRSVVQEGPLDRDLLLLSDLPGVHILSAFSPGPDYGTTNLGVSVIQAEKISGDVSVDNYGSSYTGGFRINGSVSANNLFREGDTLGAFGSSSGPGYNSGGINYTTTLNGKGTLAGIQYSAMDYRLGYGWWSPNPGAVNSTVLSALGSSGYGQSIGLWISQNIERTRNASVVVKLGYAHDIYSDTFNSASDFSASPQSEQLGTYLLTPLPSGYTPLFQTDIGQFVETPGFVTIQPKPVQNPVQQLPPVNSNKPVDTENPVSAYMTDSMVQSGQEDKTGYFGLYTVIQPINSFSIGLPAFVYTGVNDGSISTTQTK